MYEGRPNGSNFYNAQFLNEMSIRNMLDMLNNKEIMDVASRMDPEVVNRAVNTCAVYLVEASKRMTYDMQNYETQEDIMRAFHR